MMVIHKAYFPEEVDFLLKDCGEREEPRKVLMATPAFFDIVDVKNVHMVGQEGRVNKAKAREQWQALKDKYEYLKSKGIVQEVLTIEGANGCEDMVFCANQSFPWLRKDGQKVVILSNMFHDSRKREVPYFKNFYQGQQYITWQLSNTGYFEGMGDTIPHPGRQLLYGGYGHRTSLEAYHEVSAMLEVPVLLLALKDPRFYHLDTCFVPLSADSVMLCEEAFTEEGLNAIARFFKKIYTIPAAEAQEYFSLNAHVLAGPASEKKAAILQKGSVHTLKVLMDAGFEVLEVDTSEYMKSGGSVFCMKMMIY